MVPSAAIAGILATLSWKSHTHLNDGGPASKTGPADVSIKNSATKNTRGVRLPEGFVDIRNSSLIQSARLSYSPKVRKSNRQ